jgi:hypothetical protein
MSNLVKRAERELRAAGMYDDNADYGPNGVIANHVLELIKVLASGGHSGGSHFLTMELFDKLARFQALTPLTDNPEEWMDHTALSGNNPTFQNKRQGTCFSTDGGKTYYDLDEPGRPIHTSLAHTA